MSVNAVDGAFSPAATAIETRPHKAAVAMCHRGGMGLMAYLGAASDRATCSKRNPRTSAMYPPKAARRSCRRFATRALEGRNRGQATYLDRRKYEKGVSVEAGINRVVSYFQIAPWIYPQRTPSAQKGFLNLSALGVLCGSN